MALTTLAIVLAAAVDPRVLEPDRCPRARHAGDDRRWRSPIGVLVARRSRMLRWHVQPEAWPFIVASSVIELVYFWLLTTAYDAPR